MVAALILFAALWFVLCRELSSEWSVNEQYNYGWFVPFFAAVLLWLRWEDRPAPKMGNDSRVVIAVAIGVAALFLLLPIRLFEIGNPDWRPLYWIHAASVVMLTLIYIWYVGGAPWLRHFAFPVAFIFVAVPWISPVEEPVMQGLMRVVAAIASETVTLFGIPARLEGSLIRVSNGIVRVNEACSGVRSLQTSLMIGLLLGEVKRLSILRRLALVVGAVAIAFVGNCARAFFLVWIAAERNISEVERWHDLAGYAILGLVFVGSMLLAALLARKKTVAAGVPPAANPALHPTRLPLQLHPSYFLVALVWLVFVEIAAAAWYRSHERNLVPVAQWTARWPKDAAGFRESKIEEGVRATLRYDDGHQAVWNIVSNISPKSKETSAAVAPPIAIKCTLFVFRWKPGGSSVLRARAHRPDICLPSAGWQKTSDLGVTNYVVKENFSVPFHHIVFAQGRGDVVAHAFFCLQEDQLRATEPNSGVEVPNAGPPDWSFRGRSRAVFNGVRNLGQQIMELVFVSSRELDDATAEAKFAELLPALIEPRQK